MKTFLPLACGLLAVPILAAAADPAARQSEAYQASVEQDGLRRDAAAIRAELVRVRDQMREFLPDDVATVDLAIRQLDSLSKEEMERVVQALRGASKPEALTGQARALADALRDQGSISTSLKKLAVNLEARQSMQGLTDELSALLQRQVAARDELARVSHRDPTPDRLHGRDHERWEAVNEDQRRIGEDIKLLTPRLERMAGALSGGEQERFARAAALARDSRLNELADRAAQTTAQGPFDQAGEAQNGIAALLVSMEGALAADARPAERLVAFRDRLRQAAVGQQEVTTLIAGFRERQSVEDQTKRRQISLSDQIARLRAELAPLNARAAAELQAAQEAAEDASRHYERMWEERPEAQQATRDASARLEAALQAVDEQIAALPERTPATPAQLDAALAALQRDTAQAAAAAQRPNPPAERDALQKQVDDLQQRALPVSPDAAQALNEAADDLRKSDAASQQAAAQQLNKAQGLLARQQAALAGRAPGQQALAQAEANVARAQAALAQPQADLASEKTAAQAVNGFDAAKQQIANARRAAQQAGAPADAQAALAEAARDIEQAQTDAATLKLGPAQADAKAGQAALARAAQGMADARQAQTQQAAASLNVKAGNNAGQRQNGNSTQGQGNGGGGQSGDFLPGAGDTGHPPEPVSGLNPQDRAAVAQLQSQKPPAEYAADVEQYYKNIADGTAPQP